MASARLTQETKITHVDGTLFECPECGADFNFYNLNPDDPDAPRFCPNCGRRNGDA